jgi:guanylate kinase
MILANKMKKDDTDFSKNPLLIVLSGPSGVGKDAILNRMKEHRYPFFFVTTVTTRKRRESEIDRLHYHFLSVQDFQKLLEDQGLLESANVYGNWYGVPKQPIKEAIARGLDTIIKVDVQGAENLKQILPEAVFIFINTPSLDELGNRLRSRSTENADELSLRINTAKSELEKMADFDYVVINPPGDIESAVKDILAIIKAEKCRVKQRQIKL